jgi:hypothetical protein
VSESRDSSSPLSSQRVPDGRRTTSSLPDASGQAANAECLASSSAPFAASSQFPRSSIAADTEVAAVTLISGKPNTKFNSGAVGANNVGSVARIEVKHLSVERRANVGPSGRLFQYSDLAQSQGSRIGENRFSAAFNANEPTFNTIGIEPVEQANKVRKRMGVCPGRLAGAIYDFDVETNQPVGVDLMAEQLNGTDGTIDPQVDLPPIDRRIGGVASVGRSTSEHNPVDRTRCVRGVGPLRSGAPLCRIVAREIGDDIAMPRAISLQIVAAEEKLAIESAEYRLIPFEHVSSLVKCAKGAGGKGVGTHTRQVVHAAVECGGAADRLAIVIAIDDEVGIVEVAYIGVVGRVQAVRIVCIGNKV